LAEINEYAQDDVVIMLIGNKADMNAERAVRREEGMNVARVRSEVQHYRYIIDFKLSVIRLRKMRLYVRTHEYALFCLQTDNMSLLI
jgi:Ras family